MPPPPRLTPPATADAAEAAPACPPRLPLKLQARVKEIIQEEELSFSSTLKKGIAELSKRCEKLPKGGVLPGDDAFFLYDSAGLQP